MSHVNPNQQQKLAKQWPQQSLISNPWYNFTEAAKNTPYAIAFLQSWFVAQMPQVPNGQHGIYPTGQIFYINPQGAEGYECYESYLPYFFESNSINVFVDVQFNAAGNKYFYVLKGISKTGEVIERKSEELYATRRLAEHASYDFAFAQLEKFLTKADPASAQPLPTTQPVANNTVSNNQQQWHAYTQNTMPEHDTLIIEKHIPSNSISDPFKFNSGAEDNREIGKQPGSVVQWSYAPAS